MKTVRRFDVGQITKSEVTPEGFLRAPARLTRVGVFEYIDASGKVTRELRRPEQVFDPESLRSFALVPVTDEHPETGYVDADTARDLQRGSIGEIVEPDGEFVKSTIMITDRALVRKVLDGEQAEISNGYSCVVVDGAGEWRGLKYDCEQTKIRGNHVAVVPRGRAGPAARVKLDAQDAVAVPRRDDVPPPARKEPTMKTKIHGIEFEVSEQINDAINAERAEIQARIDKAGCCDKCGTKMKDGECPDCGKKKNDALVAAQARADAAAAEVVTLKKTVADAAAEQPRLLADALEVVDVARRAGVEVKLDALDLPALKVAVVEKALGLKCDGKPAGYADAAFDLAKAKIDDAPTGAAIRAAVEHIDADEEREDADEDPRGAMMKRNAEAWKSPKK